MLPSTADRRLVDALRANLDRAGFTVAGVEQLLGPVAAAALDREQSVPALCAADRAASATSGASQPAQGGGPATPPPAVVLLRLFMLGRQVARRELDAALPDVGSDGAARLGLVEAAGNGPGDAVRATVDLQPCAVDGAADWWIASDLGEVSTGTALRPDHVLGVGGASVTLVQMTMRTPRRRTLDLGTGCGIQALHAARHSDAVVGTDISARALAFAAFNAALAGVQLDLRQGSMLEPVLDPVLGARQDQQGFDLVVSNPPFVITPRTADVRYEYRDGGRAGDDLVRDLVQEIGAVLAPGGVAQMLGNWEHRRGQPWTDRVGEWVERSGLDAWVVQREVLDPAEYAETWLRDGGTTQDRDPAAWESAYRAWLDDFAAREVEAVGFGLLLLRRPHGSRPTLRRLEERTGAVRQPLGAHLATALAAHDWLSAGDDDTLTRVRLTVSPDVTEERHLVPGATDPRVVLLRQGDGFGRVVRAGTGLAALVGACDGELTVGALIDAVAQLMGVGAADLRAELIPQVRDLVRDGLLRVG